MSARPLPTISPEQLAIIEHQLGRKPRGLVGIAHQTKDGLPVVLQMRSLVDDQPFPTLYWLCSRELHHALAEIETAGWVKQIEAQLLEDESLRNRYLKNQQDYVAERWQQMFPEDKQRIETLGFTSLFDKLGIGGIAQWDKVRCLHMQYAHHLCGENVIGQRLDQEFGLDQLILKK